MIEEQGAQQKTECVVSASHWDSLLWNPGEIQIHHLTQAGFHIYPLDQFDDFEADAITMFDAFRKKG
jgi:hypothetical protein